MQLCLTVHLPPVQEDALWNEFKLNKMPQPAKCHNLVNHFAFRGNTVLLMTSVAAMFIIQNEMMRTAGIHMKWRYDHRSWIAIWAIAKIARRKVFCFVFGLVFGQIWQVYCCIWWSSYCDGPSVEDATHLRRGSTNAVAGYSGTAEHTHCKEGRFRAKQPKQTMFHQHAEWSCRKRAVKPFMLQAMLMSR